MARHGAGTSCNQAKRFVCLYLCNAHLDRTRASHSELHACLRLVRSYRRPRDSYFLRAESFFIVATEIERLDAEGGSSDPIIAAYGGRSLHEQSHGESFLALMNHRFRGQGLYILDEPEAALSPNRQLRILRRMRELVLQESQFIVATHSPILLAYPNAKILLLDQTAIRQLGMKRLNTTNLHVAF